MTRPSQARNGIQQPTSTATATKQVTSGKWNANNAMAPAQPHPHNGLQSRQDPWAHQNVAVSPRNPMPMLERAHSGNADPRAMMPPSPAGNNMMPGTSDHGSLGDSESQYRLPAESSQSKKRRRDQSDVDKPAEDRRRKRQQRRDSLFEASSTDTAAPSKFEEQVANFQEAARRVHAHGQNSESFHRSLRNTGGDGFDRNAAIASPMQSSHGTPRAFHDSLGTGTHDARSQRDPATDRLARGGLPLTYTPEAERVAADDDPRQSQRASATPPRHPVDEAEDLLGEEDGSDDSSNPSEEEEGSDEASSSSEDGEKGVEEIVQINRERLHGLVESKQELNSLKDQLIIAPGGRTYLRNYQGQIADCQRWVAVAHHMKATLPGINPPDMVSVTIEARLVNTVPSNPPPRTGRNNQSPPRVEYRYARRADVDLTTLQEPPLEPNRFQNVISRNQKTAGRRWIDTLMTSDGDGPQTEAERGEKIREMWRASYGTRYDSL